MSKSWNRDSQPRKEFHGKKKARKFMPESQIEADAAEAATWRDKNKSGSRPTGCTVLPTMYARDYRWLPFEDIADSLVDDK